VSKDVQAKEGRSKKTYILIGVALAIILLFPTPHTYTTKEPVYGYVTRERQVPYTDYEFQTKRDLVKTIPVPNVIKDGYYYYQDLYGLPDGTLYITVDISSTEDLEVLIKDTSGTIYDYDSRRHYGYIYGRGPVLYVKIANPSILGLGPDAVCSGKIEIYHEYTAKVPVIKYRTETYQSWEIIRYETKTWTEMKPWWAP